MTEEKVITIVRDHISRQFPRTCSSCLKRFGSIREWLQETTHIGDPVSYDGEVSDWLPVNPIGTGAFANCSCGSTLAITSAGMKLSTMWRLMLWAKLETRRRKIPLSELLADLRTKIDRSILEDRGTNG